MNASDSALLPPFAETAAEFRRDYSAMESAFEELFADIDHLRRELDRRDASLAAVERELAATQQRAEQDIARLTDAEDRNTKLQSECDDLRKQLAENAPSTLQLAAALQELGRLVAEAGTGGGSDVTRQFEELKELLVMRPQMTAVTGGGENDLPWGVVQTELSELRRQLFDTREALSAEIGGREDSTADSARIAELETALAAARQDFAAIEAELASTRSRMLEQHDAAIVHKQELAAEREHNARELRAVRQLLEEQANLFRAAAPNASLAAPAKPTPEAEQDPLRKTGDPVISSVMAQFAKLQKDVAQRRKK